ncbi:MAG: hypothetical protein IKU84_01335 [Clostridia bacterium]|nr:hypothetical protein [Clostridia bacterium]
MKRFISYLLVVFVLTTICACSSESEPIEITKENIGEYLQINLKESNERSKDDYLGTFYYKDITLEIYPVKDVCFENVKLTIEVPQYGAYETDDPPVFNIILPTNGYYTPDVVEESCFVTLYNTKTGKTENDPDYIIKSIEGTVKIN